MPELPEVQALANDLHSRLVGERIERADVLSFAALKTVDPPASELAGRAVEDVVRHGKFLDIVAGGLHLVVHLSLAGWIRWREGAPPPGRRRGGRIAARLVLDGGSGIDITEAGTRKGLAIFLVRDPAEVPAIAGLGPDALVIDEEGLTAVLAGAGRARIKGVLRKQSLLAGIGNAYSDEILHAARMSPFQGADMPAEDVARLHRAMREILQEAIERSSGLGASELKREKKLAMRVHGRAGEACPVCGDTIREVVYSDSSFQYCPACQTGGKLLSNRRMDRLLK